MLPRRPFRHEARSPQVRTHTFTAHSPDLRHFALVTRASRFLARSPCLAAPSIRFLFIDSRFTLRASFPRSVALPQLRFTSLAVTSLWRDLHPQVCAHAGRTKKKPALCRPAHPWQDPQRGSCRIRATNNPLFNQCGAGYGCRGQGGARPSGANAGRHSAPPACQKFRT